MPISCTDVRLDNENHNTGATQRVGQLCFDPTRGASGVMQEVWVAAAVDGAVSNRRLFYNEFDIATEVAGTPVLIESEVAGIWMGIEACNLVRLTDGRLIVAYGSFGVYTRESTDNGQTWTAIAKIDAIGAVPPVGFGATRSIATMFSNGIDVHCITWESGSGGQARDVYLFKRTGVGTWDTGRKIHDTPGFADPPYFDFSLSRLSGGPMGIMKADSAVIGDNLVGCMIADFSPAIGFGNYQLACLWTIDGWATINFSLIHDFGNTNPFGRNPMSWLGTDGRIRMAAIDFVTPNEFPVLAFSDNYGQTWTYLGTPAPLLTVAWDNSFNRAFALDQVNHWLIGVFTTNGVLEEHTLFKGGDSLLGWTQYTCGSDLNFQWAGATTGYGWVIGQDFYRVFNKTIGLGPAVNQVNVLIHHGPGDIPHEGPVCIVTPLTDYIVLPDGTVQLCGPTAPAGITYTWAWTGPGGFTATTQCIVVSVAGTYTLTVTDELGQTAVCQGVAISVPAPETTTATGRSVPHHRGVLRLTRSGHPSGTPTVAPVK
jgi:hypothetical protein